MVVTRIDEYKKGRYKVQLDSGQEFVLYRGELRKYHIELDVELSDEIVESIIHEVLPRRAKLRAMNLLMKRRMTENELRTKLKNGEYSEDIINEAMDYIASYGYINDTDYAYDYISYNKDHKSMKRIEYDMINKGIDKQTIRAAIESINDSNDPIDESAQIIKLLEKKKYNSETSTYEEKRKIYAFLCRKGFSPESVKHAMHVLDITS